MDKSLHKDLFCTQCSLQFGKKYVFDLHLSLVHGKVLEIKKEANNCVWKLLFQWSGLISDQMSHYQSANYISQVSNWLILHHPLEQ